MHILALATEYPPHAAVIGNVACSVVRQLERMGHRCIICSPSGRDIQSGSHDLIGCTGVFGPPHFWLQVSRYLNDDGYGIAWIHYPLSLGAMPFRNAMFTIHTTYHGGYANRVGSLILWSCKRLSSMIERICLRKLETPLPLTVVNPIVRDESGEIDIQRDLIHYISNGVDSEIYKPSNIKAEVRARFGLPEDRLMPEED